MSEEVGTLRRLIDLAANRQSEKALFIEPGVGKLVRANFASGA
jgi:hypothetical protein